MILDQAKNLDFYKNLGIEGRYAKAIEWLQANNLSELENGKYEIVAGERRFRASKLAGLTTIPAYIRKTEDESLLELALIENIQREDLNAIEVAISYQRLMDECNLTQDALSERVGKKRSTIGNYLRLLKLPPQIQLAVRDKKYLWAMRVPYWVWKMLIPS